MQWENVVLGRREQKHFAGWLVHVAEPNISHIHIFFFDRKVKIYVDTFSAELATYLAIFLSFDLFSFMKLVG